MAISRRRPYGSGSQRSGPSRRQLLAGGAGAGALLAFPVLPASGGPTTSGVTSGAASGTAADTGAAASGSWYAFLYGSPDSAPYPGGSVMAAKSPALTPSPPPAPFQIASNLASAPVLSPDQTTVALATVATTADAATVTLTLTGKATAAASKHGTLTLTGEIGRAHV